MRGIDNNNPLNLKDFNIPWDGMVRRDDKGFCVFATPVAGIRAGTVNLLSGYVHKNTKTVTLIIARHAPSIGDDGKIENPEAAYIKFVCGKLGVKPDEQVNLKDRLVLFTLVNAIIEFEDAHYAYPADVVYEAVDLALDKFK